MTDRTQTHTQSVQICQSSTEEPGTKRADPSARVMEGSVI